MDELLPLFLTWYEELQRGIKVHGYSDFTQGQLTMISNVLKQLMSARDYKKLTGIVGANRAKNTNLF